MNKVDKNRPVSSIKHEDKRVAVLIKENRENNQPSTIFPLNRGTEGVSKKS